MIMRSVLLINAGRILLMMEDTLIFDTQLSIIYIM